MRHTGFEQVRTPVGRYRANAISELGDIGAKRVSRRPVHLQAAICFEPHHRMSHISTAGRTNRLVNVRPEIRQPVRSELVRLTTKLYQIRYSVDCITSIGEWQDGHPSGGELALDTFEFLILYSLCRIVDSPAGWNSLHLPARCLRLERRAFTFARLYLEPRDIKHIASW